MALRFYPFIIGAILSLLIIHLQAETFPGQNPCISKTTCHECIQTPSCAWCSQPADQFGEHPRCFQPAGQQQLHKQCPRDFMYFPSNNYIITTARELHKGQGSSSGSSGGTASGQGGVVEGGGNSAGGGGGGSAAAGQSSGSSSGQGGADIVQITPQRLQMKLRAQESQSVHVYFAQAEDYPVDLYYLMDLSKSMEDDKEKLSVLGELLSSTMRKMTSNFQLGFGSFVDKVVMPYVNTVESKLKMPCTNCTAPYGYKNHLTLSNDTTLFSVALILGVAGACRVKELVDLEIDDVRDLGDSFLIAIRNTKNKIDRNFVIKNSENSAISFVAIVRKYVALRKTGTPHSKFFVQYINKECTTRVVGKNMFGTYISTANSSFLEIRKCDVLYGTLF